MSPKDADGMANSVDPDQTVCPGQSVWKLELITVCVNTIPKNFIFSNIWEFGGSQILSIECTWEFYASQILIFPNKIIIIKS